MLELPEAMNLARELNENVIGKTVEAVLPPTKPHKFCFFTGVPAEYGIALAGRRAESASGFGMFTELIFDGGVRLCVNDGVNVRLTDSPPADYQLLLRFESGSCLAYTVAMYGGISLTRGEPEGEYYRKSASAPRLGTAEFGERFRAELAACKSGMSAKAFLATEQRFPGVGNGSAQDILFRAGINPKRRIGSLTDTERERFPIIAEETLLKMIADGGRDTEKDLFGRPRGYKTAMSKNNYPSRCPVCGAEIKKEQYMGGSVYYCPVCQPV